MSKKIYYYVLIIILAMLYAIQFPEKVEQQEPIYTGHFEKDVTKIVTDDVEMNKKDLAVGVEQSEIMNIQSSI